MATALPIVVYQPASLAIDFYATDPDNNNAPIDLTSVTEIAVSVISKTPPTCVTKLLSLSGVVIIGSPLLGHFQAQFSTTDVLDMPLSTQDLNDVIDTTTLSAITIKITDPTNPNRNPFVVVQNQALAVFAAPC